MKDAAFTTDNEDVEVDRVNLRETPTRPSTSTASNRPGFRENERVRRRQQRARPAYQEKKAAEMVARGSAVGSRIWDELSSVERSLGDLESISAGKDGGHIVFRKYCIYRKKYAAREGPDLSLGERDTGINTVMRVSGISVGTGKQWSVEGTNIECLGHEQERKKGCHGAIKKLRFISSLVSWDADSMGFMDGFKDGTRIGNVGWASGVLQEGDLRSMVHE
ncbi:hypothetical protein C8J57DRAFT_1231570 [Mycena rebaudengoi]|nr:hypothetical protein C8J57DRAFT_1231570 [Mycena rebaudengoi]